MKFKKVIGEKLKNKERIISLGLGEPYLETPKEIIDATIEALLSGKTKYGNCFGIPPLKQKIAHKLRSDNGIDANEDNIGITFGAKQAIYISLLALLEPGDEVLNFTPCYLSYEPQVKLAEKSAKLININLNKGDFSFDFDQVKTKINEQTKVIILNSPHNPTGKVYSRSEMDSFAELLREYPNVYVISDEIYEYMLYSDKPHISIGSYSDISHRVFTVNGFSKPFSMTGWRIGYLHFPAEFKQKIFLALQHINTNVTTFIQHGAAKAYDVDPQYYIDYKNQLRSYVDLMKQEFEGNEYVKLVTPEGGLFTFCDISATGMDSDSFAAELLESENVALNPGIIFGKDWDEFIRISFGCPFEEFRKGISGIKNFLNKKF
jgi:aspartate aminotransferase